MCRKQLEILEPLLKHLVYVRSDSQSKLSLEQTMSYINSKNFAQYCEYQQEHKDCLA